jgi:glycosyltransferase involved in cell wall biosynthesis
VQARLGLAGQSYIAFLGMLEPRKNVPGLIRGWVQACEGRSSPRPWCSPAARLGRHDRRDDGRGPSHLRVLRPGYLRFSDLPGYLGGAVLVAYPSHGEGFGLPVLEAMACGAPVLTTQRLSLPEVGGDAVAYTEPDPESIAAALRALLDDPDRREQLGEAGHERSLEFTWAASAEAHLAAFRRALEP